MFRPYKGGQEPYKLNRSDQNEQYDIERQTYLDQFNDNIEAEYDDNDQHCEQLQEERISLEEKQGEENPLEEKLYDDDGYRIIPNHVEKNGVFYKHSKNQRLP